MPTTVIIGAGVSGLQTAAAFLRIGHVVVVLERQEDVGGVWLNYTAFSVQVPRHFFSLPDFPAPPELDLEEYPSGRSLLRYIIAYAHKNDLYRHIVFRAKVTRLHRLGGSWQCFYSLEGSAVQHRMIADFVVVCTGLHSTPNIPPVESAHLFAGRILHVQDLPDTADQLADQVAGCRVVVVGGSKTAVDTATRLGSAGAAEITVVYRKAHWPMSRYPLGGKSRLHFTRLLHSRLASTMAGPYYTASLWGRATGAITKPLRRLFWRYIERRLVVQHGLAGNLMPSMNLEQDLLSGGIVHDGKWTQLLATGEVVAIKGEPQRYTHDGLVLRGGGFLEADMVVYATGHRKDYAFIDADISSKLGVQRDGLYLYRHVLPPLVRNIAFVGAEANSLNNPLTAFLQAEWLVSCLQGRVKLPSPQVMMRDLQRKIRWQRQKLPPQPDRASMLGIFVHRYHDQLLKDMGVSPRRKSSPWRECFEPYTAADYREAVRQLRGTPLIDDNRHDDSSQPPYGVAADSLGPLNAAAGGSGLRQRSGATSSPARHSVDDDAFDAGGGGRMTPTRIRISAAAAAAVAPDVYDMANGEMSVGFGLTPAYGRSGSRARHLPGERGPSLDGTGGGSGGRVSRRISLGLVGEEGVRHSRASASSSGAAPHGHPHAATDSGAFSGGRLSNSAAGLGQRALAAAAAFVGRSSRSGGKPGGPGGGSGSGGARAGQQVNPLQAHREQHGAARAHRSLDGSVAPDGSLGLARPHAPSSHRASTTAYPGAAAGTPPDTPTTAATVPYLYPYSYMALAVGARAGPGVYIPPSSGRSCLMDAEELAMVDGVVGGALRDREPEKEKETEKEKEKEKEEEKEKDTPSAVAAGLGSVSAGQGEAGPRARSLLGETGGRGAGGSATGASRFGPAAGVEARQQQQQPRGAQPGSGLAGAPGNNEAAAGEQGASAVAWGEELQERTSGFGRPSGRAMPVAVAPAAGARPALGDTGAFGSFQVLAGSDPARTGSAAAAALATGPASAPVPLLCPGQSGGEDEDGQGDRLQRRRTFTAVEGMHEGPALVAGPFIPWVATPRGAPPPPSGADTGAYLVIPDEDGDAQSAAVSPAAQAEPEIAVMPFALASPFMTLAQHQHTNGSDGSAQQPRTAPPAVAGAATAAHPGVRPLSPLQSPGLQNGGAGLTPAAAAAATAASAFNHQRRPSAGTIPQEDPHRLSGGMRRSSSASVQHLHITVPLCTAAAAAAAARRDSNGSSLTSVSGLSNPGGEGSSRIPSTSTDPLATGGSRAGKPRPLVQLVAMRQAGGGGNMPDSPVAANGGGGNGSVGIMGSSQRLSLRTGGLDGVHDSSDMDFVGTPPSCFGGPLSELQRDQAGGLGSGLGDAESSMSTDDFATYSEDLGPLSGAGAHGRRGSLTGAHQGHHPAYYRQAATTYGQVGSGGPVTPEEASAKLRKAGLGGAAPGDEGAGVVEVGPAEGSALHGRELLDRQQREQGGEHRLQAGGAAADSGAAWDFGRRGAVHPRGRASMSVVQGGAGGAGPAPGGENGGRASLALERYAARMTAAPAFRMSMTNMADMAPQALKHGVAARASAIAAATHGSMPGSSLHTPLYSAPSNALFLSASIATAGPGGGGGSGIHLGALAGAQRTEHQTYSHNARMPGRMARVPDPLHYDGVADLDPGGDSFCVVPGMGLLTIEDNETGGQEVTSGNVGRSGEVSTAARSGPLSETSRSRSGPVGSPGGADGGVGAGGGGGLMLKGPGVRQVQQAAQRQAALAKSPSAGRGPSAMSPFSRMTAAVGMVVLRQAGGSNGSGGGGGGGGDDSPASGPLHAAGGPHGAASPNRVSVNGAGGGSAGPGVPPGSSSSGTGGGAAPGGGSWDLTFKQLSRAVVAPPQRGPGVIRAAMISKRALLQSNSNTSDRPSESGTATPTGGSFFSARRALGAGGLDDGTASGTASPGTPLGAPGGGMGATSRGGLGGGGGALSSGTASPQGAADRLLVQPSGPAVVPIREPSRFLVRSNSSKNRMQGAHGADGNAGSVHGAAAAAFTAAGENGGADAAAAAVRGVGGGGASGSLGAVLPPNGRETSLATKSRSNWNPRLQSEGTKSAMQAVMDAARARRASLHYTNPPPPQLESPMFAKLVAASQSHTGIAQGQPGQLQAPLASEADAWQAGSRPAKAHMQSPLRPATFRSGEVPLSEVNQALGIAGRGAGVAGSAGVAAAMTPLNSDPLLPVRMASGADVGGLHGSHGRGLRQSSSVIAPELATLGPSALAVTAAAAAATTSTVSAVAGAGGGGGGGYGWDGGSMAKSFKRLSGILLPSMGSGREPTLGAAGSGRTSFDAPRNADAGGAGAAGDGTAAGGGGGGGGAVRFLKRMVSGKRRSMDGPVLPGWSSSTGGGAGGGTSTGTAATPLATAPALGVIGTVDEGMEGAVELPPPPSSPPYAERGLGPGATAAAAVPHAAVAAGGGGGSALHAFPSNGSVRERVSDAREPYDLELPPVALAAAVLGRSASRRHSTQHPY